MGHAGNFNLSHARAIRRVVAKVLAKRKVRTYFFGICFGKYDFVIEFISPSSKIASDIACEISNKIKKRLRNTQVKTCMSLLFGVEATTSDVAAPSENYNSLRAYVFVQPSSGELLPMVSAVASISRESPTHTNMLLLWTQGVHKVLLISGPCYEGIVQKLETFRHQMKGEYRETSTCLAIDYNKEVHDGKDIATVAHTHTRKPAVIYLKTKTPGAILVPKRSGIVKFPGENTRQMTRLGGFDALLLARKQSLWDLLNLLDRIRTMNTDTILSTSTVLLYRGEIG